LRPVRPTGNNGRQPREDTMAEELRDILRNRVKEKLARDEVVASMTVRLCRSIEIARIAATAGFDTIYVDVEHNTLSIDAVCQICIAAMQCGITPLVRVPANTPEFICRLLDGGAMGVIAPHVRSAEEAREVVRYAKFTPQGERGAGGALPHYHYRSFPSAVVNQAMNDATMVVVMMETVAALEHVEEIAAVDGVDMMLIGTNDLCNEMGITGQFDHANVRDAYLRTIAACRKHGKHVGVGGLASRPELMAEYVRQGARYVSTGTDLSFLLAAAAEKAKFVRDI
jgi:4-hydroxy-2-oxoheptanedioate aldolase